MLMLDAPTIADPFVTVHPGSAKPKNKAFDAYFTLLAFSQHRPEFKPQLQGVSTSLGGTPLEDKELLTKVTLLPEHLHSVLTSAFGLISAVKNEFTIPYEGISAIRVLPRARAEEFFAAFADAKAKFDRAIAEDFFPFYEEQVRVPRAAYWKPILGDRYERCIGRHIQPLEAIRGKIGVEVRKFSISYEEVENADAAIHDLSLSLRGRIADAVEDLKDQIASGKKVTKESFNKLGNAIKVMRGFSEFADARLLREMDSVETRIKEASDAAGAAATLRIATMTQTIRGMAPALGAGLDSLLASCRDESGVQAAVDQFGAAARPIRRAKAAV